MSSRPKCERNHTTTYSSDADRGLNQSIVPEAQEAFTQYANDIQTAIEEFKASVTNYDSALFGTASDACRQHINKAIDSCYDILNRLSAFQAQLTEAAEKYIAQDSSVAGSL